MDDFVGTRQLATTLGSLSTDTSNLMGTRKGVIVSVEDGPPSTCTITLSGDPTEIAGIAYLDSYTPVEGETVIIGKQGGSLLILGTTEHNGGGGGSTAQPFIVLQRTTNQAVAHNTFVAVSWSSQVTNQGGPGTWWASGTPTQLVMPWAGLYRAEVNLCWEQNSSNERSVYLHQGTTLSYGNIVAANGAQNYGSFQENTHHSDLSYVFNVASASTVFLIIAYQNSGSSLNLTTRHAQIPGVLTITYLGEP